MNGTSAGFHTTCAVLAATAGIGAALAPGFTLAVVGAAVVVLVFIAAPKLAAVLTVVAVLVDQSLEQVTGISEMSYLDEAGVVLCVVFFAMRRIGAGHGFRRLPGAAWFGLYVLSGLVSSVIHGVEPDLALGGCFLLIKGPLLALAFAQLDWAPTDARRAARIGAVGMVVVLLLGAVNFVIPGAWTSVLALEAGGGSERVAGLPNLIGPFVHPSAFGQVCALGVVAVVAYRATVRTGPASALLLAGTALGTVLSFRRAATVGMIVAAVVARVAVPGRRVSSWLLTLLVTPVVLLLLWEALVAIAQVTYADYLADPTSAARSLMYFDSVRIAVEHAPFGVGFARYGSYFAGVDYSPEYRARGYEAVWGLGPETAGEESFLTDTFWPAILGEAGFLGLIGYGVGLVLLARCGLHLRRRASDPHTAWLGVVVVAWSVEFVVESLANAVHTSPPTFGLLFAAAGIAAALTARPDRTATDDQDVAHRPSSQPVSG
jgi:hypothetical protein